MINLQGKLDTEDTVQKSSDDEQFLEVVRKRYQNAQGVWEPVFEKYRSDCEFANGDMWDSSLKSKRKVNNLSCLTVDKITPKINYIVNNALSNMPAIKVRPVRDGASENTAKVFDGLIKSIEYRGNAKQARINAHKQNVTGGLGAWRLLPFVDEDGDADIKYERIIDPTSVLMDPNATEQDFSDAKYAFVTTWMAKDVFEEEYPGVTTQAYSAENNNWYSQDAVQVVEYWCKGEDGLFDNYLLTAENVLKKVTDYEGKYLPIMYLTGSEYTIGGAREYKGIVRGVRDMQVLHNLTKSRTADYIARSAEAQWLVEGEMIADYKDTWQKANVSGTPVLPYKATSSGGKPQRIDPLTPPTGLIEASKETDEDIRMTIGIRDPLADIPSSQSGKAIALQISQGNIGTYEYADRLNTLIKYEGKVLVDLIPKIFSDAHIREIMGEDGNVTPVQLNQPYEENGEIVEHDLSKGKYLVTISTGASYESQRSETADKLIELVGKYPDFMTVAGDLIVRNMDFVGKDELADRLKATIAPNILASTNASNGDKAEQAIAQLNAQLQDMAQQLQDAQMQTQQLQQVNAQLQQDQQTKATEIQLKSQADIQTMQTKAQIDLQVAREKARFDAEIAQLKMAHEQKMKMLELGVGMQTKGMEHQHNLEAIKTKGDVDGMLSALGSQHKQDEIKTKGDVDGMLADLNSANTHKQIQEKTHSDIFLEQMKADIAENSLKKTGEDLSY